MHELSVATGVLNTVLKHAGDRPVEAVAMRVGAMRQVVPESLRFYWEIVARDTVCENARLDLTVVDAKLRCERCRREWMPSIPVFRCPDCGAAGRVAIVAGDELSVEYLELKEPIHA
jgi:hydrogenase nickel incorporation protein HypA/HybF